MSLMEKLGVEDVRGWLKRVDWWVEDVLMLFSQRKNCFSFNYSRGKLTMSYHYQVANNCGVV